MTREERHRLLSPAEIADAQSQARRAVSTVGIPQELIDRLRPILAPAARVIAAQEAATRAEAA
ncbi:hypothetical protein ACKI1J_15760 [Streptomyces scabiei]|uniref:hypothetical protein n=1 Tax=Streptomyces scabiei TaxID=1930 RepID=UPI0038F819C2